MAVDLYFPEPESTETTKTERNEKVESPFNFRGVPWRSKLQANSWHNSQSWRPIEKCMIFNILEEN